MAKDDDFNFDFDDDFDFDMGGGDKKASFFKDLAKGIVVGAAQKFGEYVPTAKDTAESLVDMTDQIRDQASAVQQLKNKLDPYTKMISESTKQIIQDMKSSPGLKGKIGAFESGVDKMKKDLAYQIDPETAKSFDMDSMWDDSGSSSSSVTPGKSTSKVDSSTSTKLRNEKLGLDPMAGVPNMNAGLSSGRGGRTIINKFGGDYGNAKARIESERLGNEILRESMFAVGSSIVSQQAKIFKQTTIINTKQHIEKMSELRKLSEATVLQTKLFAEKIAPAITQTSARMEKVEAQLTDMIALLRESNENAFASMHKGLHKKRGGRKNMSDFITSYGGIDFGGLYKHLTGEIKETADGFGLGMLSSMKDMLPMMLMGGNKTSIGEFIGKNIGKMAVSPFQKKLRGIGDQVQSMIPALMMNAYGKMQNSSNSFVSGLADLLNIDTGTKRTVDLDNKNRRIGFDTVTRKSIVEVIPQLLAKIHQAVSGGKEEIAFDYKTGQFTTKSNLQQRVKTQIDDAGMGSLGSIKYRMQRLDNSIDNKSMDKMLRTIMLEGGVFNPKDVENASKFMQRFKDEGIDEKTSRNFMKLVTRKLSGAEQGELIGSINRARTARKSELDRKAIDMAEYGQGSLIGVDQLDAQIKDLERKKRRLKGLSGGTGGFNMSGTDAMKRWKKENAELDSRIAELRTIRSTTQGDVGRAAGKATDPMSKIYDLLLKGIIVYPRQVDKMPRHIKKALGAEARIIEAQKAQLTAAKQAAENYEMSQRAIHESEAEELENSRIVKRMTALDKVRMLLGGENSALSKKIAGDDSVLGKVLNGISNSKVVSALSRIKGKIDKSLDTVSAGLKESSGFDGMNMAGEVVSGIAGGARMRASAAKSTAQGLYNDAKNGKLKDHIWNGAKSAFNTARRGAEFVRDKANEYDVAGKVKTGAEYLYGKAKEHDLMGKARRGAEFVRDKANEYDVVDKVKAGAGMAYDKLKTGAGTAYDALKGSDIPGKVKTTTDKMREASQGVLGQIKEAFFGVVKPGQKEDDGPNVEIPSNMKTNMSTESMDKSTREKLKHPNGLGLVDMLGAMMSGTMSKLNRVLFGLHDDKFKNDKGGFIDKIFQKTGILTDNISKFLFGDKDKKTYGLVHQIAGPAMRVVEEGRHKIMKKLINPFIAIGQSMKHTLKWGLRDSMERVNNFMVRIRGSVAKREAKKAAKAKKKAEKLAKINAKRAAKGKAPISATLLGKLGDIAISPFSMVAGAGLGRAGKNMRKLLSQGKISQDDYDKWVTDQEARNGSEDALHAQHMDEINNFQEKLDWSRVTDQKLKAEMAGYNEANAKQRTEIANMDWKDIKADRKRAKAQQKLNAAKIKRGEKLTQEEEYGALTAQQKLYRMEDDAKKKLKSEVDRQKETEDKYRTEMEKSRTDLLSGILFRLSNGAAGKPYNNDRIPGSDRPVDNGPSISEELNDKIKSQSPASLADGHVDLKTGHEEGSRADQVEDERARIQTEGMTAMALLPDKIDQLIGKTGEDKSKKKKDGGPNLKETMKGILSSLGGIGTMLAGIASMALGAAALKGMTNWGKNIKNRFKKQGVTGGIGELTGIDASGDSKFDMDGNEKSGLQQAMDRFKAGRFIFQHRGIQRTAKLLGGGAGKILKGGGKIIGAPIKGFAKAVAAPVKLVSKLAGKGAKGGKMAAKLASKSAAAGKAGNKITRMLEGFFKIPAIKKRIGKTAGAKLIKTIGAKVAKSAAGRALGGALKFLSGPVGIAAMAATDFATGAAQAKRYFKIGAGDKATKGMRVAAGVANALNNGLLLGLVPMDWMVDKIYRMVADPKEEAELDRKQEAFRERAAALGVDPERLNELENKTLGKKFLNIFKSKDKKLREEAALMGMDVEDYKVWKQKYEKGNASAQDKGVKAGEAKLSTMMGEMKDADLSSTQVKTHSKNIADASFIFGYTREGKTVTRSVMDAAIKTSADMAKITNMDSSSLKKMVEVLELGKKKGDPGAIEALKLMHKEQRKRFLSNTKDAIKNKVMTTWNDTKTAARAMANAAKWIGKGGFFIGKKIFDFNLFVHKAIFKGLGKSVELFKTGAAFIGGKILAGTRASLDKFKDFKDDIGEKLSNALSKLSDKLKAGLSAFAEGFGSVMSKVGSTVKTGFTSIFGKSKSKSKASEGSSFIGAWDSDDEEFNDISKRIENLHDDEDYSGNTKKLYVDLDDVYGPTESTHRSFGARVKSIGKRLKDWAFSKIQGPAEASKYFSKNDSQNQRDLKEAFMSDPQAVYDLADAIRDPRAMGQQTSMNTLQPEFAKRVNAFLNDPRVKGHGVRIREGRRSLLTQLAYFSKARAPREVTDTLMKKAGFSAGAGFWGSSFTGPNTWTMKTNHADGYAVDLEHGNLTYDQLGAIAKDYGLDWGGYWSAPHTDKPHFEFNKDWKGTIDKKWNVKTVEYKPSSLGSVPAASSSPKIASHTTPRPASSSASSSSTVKISSHTAPTRPPVTVDTRPKVSDVTATNDIHLNHLGSLAESATIAKENSDAVAKRAEERKSAELEAARSTSATNLDTNAAQAHADMVAQTRAIEEQTKATTSILAKILEREELAAAEARDYAEKARQLEEKRGYKENENGMDPTLLHLMSMAPGSDMSKKQAWAHKQYVDRYAAQYADIGS